MDFLDPKKTRAHTIRLYVGYILLAVAIVMAAVVLLYQAGGYGVNRDGEVIQNGLVFVSSSPSGAQITLNGKKSSATNSRLSLQAGSYTMKLSREGYRDWQRALTIEGGSVEHVDYPLLFPNQLDTSAVADYQAQSPMVTQSPDRRWVAVQLPGEPGSFDVYDVKDPERVKQQKTTVSVPAAVLGISAQDGQQQSFELEEWSRDNDHMLLKHITGGQSEYILFSRTEPQASVNLTTKLQLKPSETVTLRDKKFDRYFIHDTQARTLTITDLDNATPAKLLDGVISYKSYGDDVVLYATAKDADEGKTSIKLYQFGQSYQLRQLTATDKYLLDISTYGSDWYVVAGTAADDHVYVYENAAQKLRDKPDMPLVPANILKVNDPNYVEFSANSQMVMAENGQDIAVYDVENERSSTYRLERPIDQPQQHVTWMDGFHLVAVSEGKALVFDYDGTNVQSLAAASADFIPYFDTSYQTLYTFAPIPAQTASGQSPTAQQASGAARLNMTPLRTVRDR